MAAVLDVVSSSVSLRDRGSSDIERSRGKMRRSRAPQPVSGCCATLPPPVAAPHASTTPVSTKAVAIKCEGILPVAHRPERKRLRKQTARIVDRVKRKGTTSNEQCVAGMQVSHHPTCSTLRPLTHAREQATMDGEAAASEQSTRSMSVSNGKSELMRHALARARGTAAVTASTCPQNSGRLQIVDRSTCSKAGVVDDRVRWHNVRKDGMAFKDASLAGSAAGATGEDEKCSILDVVTPKDDADATAPCGTHLAHCKSPEGGSRDEASKGCGQGELHLEACQEVQRGASGMSSHGVLSRSHTQKRQKNRVLDSDGSDEEVPHEECTKQGQLASCELLDARPLPYSLPSYLYRLLAGDVLVQCSSVSTVLPQPVEWHSQAKLKSSRAFLTLASMQHASERVKAQLPRAKDLSNLLYAPPRDLWSCH
jgi:hypothetical protein